MQVRPESKGAAVREQREDNHIPAEEPILFLEVDVDDPSEFADVLEVRGVEVGGHWVLCVKSSTVPNTIAAFLLHLRDTTGKTPHCYFGWTEGNPIVHLVQLPPLRGGGHRPGHPRGLEGGRAGPRAASHHPRRRSITCSGTLSELCRRARI